MTKRCHKILIVEPNPEVLEVVVSSLSRRLDAQLTCVASGNACIDAELTDPHDLIIAENDLEDMDGLTLAQRLMSLATRPVVLLVGEVEYGHAVSALRTGVADIFRKPFPVEKLLESAEQLLCEHRLLRQRASRYHQMRKLVRHVIRERRDLRRRIELVCRDLVGAQRRLVHRVLAMGDSQPQPGA